jgi:putative transposase
MLNVPYRRRKKRLRGKGVVMGAMSLIRPNVLWGRTLDFEFDQTSNVKTLKLLNVIDEFTFLERLATERDAPMYLRFDIHGPEFIANALADWCRFALGYMRFRPTGVVLLPTY